MKKSVLIIGGDKGGIGKSTFAEVAAEYCAGCFGQALVVEGDALIQDVAPRSQNVEGMSVVTVDLARADASEEAITLLFGVIEEQFSRIDHIVINTPASVSATLDKQSELISNICKEMGYALVFGWMVDAGEDSARLSLQSQLAQLADYRVAIINERHVPARRMPWWKHAAREKWLSQGGFEVSIPPLSDHVMTKIRAAETTPYNVLASPSGGLNIADRMAWQRWLKTATQAAATIYDTVES